MSIKKQTFKSINIMLFNNERENNIDIKVIKLVDNYFHCPKYRGPSALRNFGLTKSKAKYVSIIDGDDCWHKDKLKYQIAFAQKHPNSIIYTRIINDYGYKKIIDKTKLRSGYIFKDLILNEISITGSMSGIFFSNYMMKILKKKYGYIFDESLDYCEDFDLFVRLSENFYFYPIDKPLVFITKSQISHQSNFSNFERTKIKYKMLSKNLEKNIFKFKLSELLRFYFKSRIIIFIKFILQKIL